MRPAVRALHAYAEESTGGLNLMANTNLFGPNPAIERALARITPTQLADYPSLTSDGLRGAIANKLGVSSGMVVTGHGSNDLIDVVCRTFLEPGDRVAFHTPTFSMIPPFVRTNHGEPVDVPLGDDWALDVDGLLAARAKVTFVVRPNNPTGNAFPRDAVERIVREAEGVVVVDEAYGEFLDEPGFVQEVRAGRDNLVVLRTFSKAHGLAGLRAGYAVAGAALAAELAKVRGPFRLDALAETTAKLAVEDDAFLEKVVQAVRTERPALQRLLEAHGFHVFASDANFLLTRPPTDANELAQALAERGIHVRDFGGAMAPYLRITVGPPQASARLHAALEEILGGAKA